MLAASLTAIDTFVDALWLEDGLARNTLAAYRRDLTLYAPGWLASNPHWRWMTRPSTTCRPILPSAMPARGPPSANRRLTVFKRYFRWALRERRISADPTLRLQAARQPLRVPKTLSRRRWRRCWRARRGHAAGPARPHHAGADVCQRPARERAGHAQGVHVGLNEGVLRVMGKGSKERLVPFGEEAH
jgi:integrase/recombinase XerD